MLAEALEGRKLYSVARNGNGFSHYENKYEVPQNTKTRPYDQVNHFQEYA